MINCDYYSMKLVHNRVVVNQPGLYLQVLGLETIRTGRKKPARCLEWAAKAFLESISGLYGPGISDAWIANEHSH